MKFKIYLNRSTNYYLYYESKGGPREAIAKVWVPKSEIIPDGYEPPELMIEVSPIPQPNIEEDDWRDEVPF